MIDLKLRVILINAKVGKTIVGATIKKYLKYGGNFIWTKYFIVMLRAIVRKEYMNYYG
jgi:hypothetical protein